MYGQGVVLEAVRRNGLALRHASGALRADRHVVLCAIRECPMSLEHAHAPRIMRKYEDMGSRKGRRGHVHCMKRLRSPFGMRKQATALVPFEKSLLNSIESRV